MGSKKKCPSIIIVSPNFDLYIKMSGLVRDILRSYSDQIEAFGIDENWLDVTENLKLNMSGREIAEKIQRRIICETGLTTSIGIS